MPMSAMTLNSEPHTISARKAPTPADGKRRDDGDGVDVALVEHAEHDDGEGYVYPHDDPSGVVLQQYRPEALEGRVYLRADTPRGRRRRPGPGRRQGGPFVNRDIGGSGLCWLRLSAPPRCSGGARPSRCGRRGARGGAPPGGTHIPADAARLGSAPSGQVLPRHRPGRTGPHRTAAGGGGGSTPGSPDYRHYLIAAQYASDTAPAPPRSRQVSSVLRSED